MVMERTCAMGTMCMPASLMLRVSSARCSAGRSMHCMIAHLPASRCTLIRSSAATCIWRAVITKQ